jgi:hypothetical protein
MRHGRTGLAACNLGAPHQRERHFFVADADSIQRTPEQHEAKSKELVESGTRALGLPLSVAAQWRLKQSKVPPPRSSSSLFFVRPISQGWTGDAFCRTSLLNGRTPIAPNAVR